ncbi:MAG: hypothetical protein AB1500_02855 [Bacillota bacterium]
MRKRSFICFIIMILMIWVVCAENAAAEPAVDKAPVTQEPAATTTPPADYMPVASPPETHQSTLNGEVSILADQTATALLIQDYYPWDRNSNEQVLQEFGITYDRINSSQLGGWDLSPYRLVMYASDQPTSYYYNIYNNLGKISAYVENGGLLIAHCCDLGWNDGYWYYITILPGNIPHSGVYTLFQNLHIEDPSHPVVEGLTDSALSDWNYSTHGFFPTLPAGGKVIVSTNYAGLPQPTYIEYPYGNGRVLATMQTVEWGYGDWGTYNWYVNGPELLRNEVRYAQTCQQGVISSAALDKREFDPSGDYEGEDLSKCTVMVTTSEAAYVTIDIVGAGGELITSLLPRMAAAGTPEAFTWAGDRYAPNHQIVYEGSYTMFIRARSGPSADSPLLGEVSRWVTVKWHMDG